MYCFTPDLFTPQVGAAAPTLTGVNEASTFRGFCNVHDGAAFAEIDRSFSDLNAERAFLFAYRALSRELHAKRGVVALTHQNRDADRGRSPADQVRLQTMMGDYLEGLESGLSDLERDKQRMDTMLLSKEYDAFQYLAFETDSRLPVLCSGIASVDYDFNGSQLQDLSRLENPATSIFFSAVANGEGGLLTFGWLRGDEASASLVDSLLSVPEDELPDRLLSFLFVESDNLCIAPDWWEGLTPIQEKFLLKKMMIGLDIYSPIDPAGLSGGGPPTATWTTRRVDEHQHMIRN